MTQFKVNFSDQEAASEARSFEAIPSGSYYARITNIETREVVNEPQPGKKDNRGENYWNVECTIQEGPFENSKQWSNVMLFDGALYTLAQLCKATGFADRVTPGDKNFGKIPPADDFLSKEVIIVVAKQRDTYKEKLNNDGVALWKNEIKGFKPYAGAGSTTASGQASNSKLP